MKSYELRKDLYRMKQYTALSKNKGNIEVTKYLQSWDCGKKMIKHQKGNTPKFTH